MIYYPSAGSDYDVAHPAIRTNADKEFAKVFRETLAGGRSVRVLCFTKEEALPLARNFADGLAGPGETQEGMLL